MLLVLALSAHRSTCSSVVTRCAVARGRTGDRVKRSRALSWLCTLAAAAALVLVLFPVYAIIVGSFESTNTLFSGTFYWLPHAATLDNYSTVIHAQSANV